MKPCPIHGKPALVIYPCCIGAKGGQAASPAKVASARVNVAKARIARQARQATHGGRIMPGDGLEADRGP